MTKINHNKNFLLLENLKLGDLCFLLQRNEKELNYFPHIFIEFFYQKIFDEIVDRIFILYSLNEQQIKYVHNQTVKQTV